jgi:hypothetical protein
MTLRKKHETLSGKLTEAKRAGGMVQGIEQRKRNTYPQ